MSGATVDDRRILHDDEEMQLSFIARNPRHLVICFAGIGHAVGGVNVQMPEFRRMCEDASVMHVLDKKRSWGNNLDFERIAREVAAHAPGAVLDAIGNSMGGFNAILSTKFLKVRTCIAFVPQFSIHPEVMPDEMRWRPYLRDIVHWRHRDLADAFQPATRYYLFAGSGGADDPHLERFPDDANIEKLFLLDPRFDHEVAQELRRSERLYDVIADCFAGRNAREIAAARFPGEPYCTRLHASPRG